jgi:hypothetical protein
LKCDPPCLTCAGSRTYCTTCNAGYQKLNWKCQSTTYVGFKFVIAQESGSILNSIDSVVGGLLTILGQNTSNVSAITLQSIQTGSTIVSGTYTPTSESVIAAASQLTSGLAGGLPGTSFKVTGVSVVGVS